jgi:Domain of unknown function (DUF309)
VFFEQHETLGLAWIDEADPVRYLYQGILQVGVGCALRRGHAYGGSGGGASATWNRLHGGRMEVDVDCLIADRALPQIARACRRRARAL